MALEKGIYCKVFFCKEVIASQCKVAYNSLLMAMKHIQDLFEKLTAKQGLPFQDIHHSK